MKLSDAEITSQLAALPGWSYENGKLHRDFRFANFVEAFRFMTACALEAEAMNHHPEWFNVWNRVAVDLATHDAGGVTAKDFGLAQKMNQWAAGAAA